MKQFELELNDTSIIHVEDKNPMCRAYGTLDGMTTCATCAHFIEVQRAKIYYRCVYRKGGYGATTDHRKRWKACNKYEFNKNNQKRVYGK